MQYHILHIILYDFNHTGAKSGLFFRSATPPPGGGVGGVSGQVLNGSLHQRFRGGSLVSSFVGTRPKSGGGVERCRIQYPRSLPSPPLPRGSAAGHSPDLPTAHRCHCIPFTSHPTPPECPGTATQCEMQTGSTVSTSIPHDI